MDNPLVQPDPGLFIWTILTFLVLLGLLAKFAWGPLLKALEERQETIRKSLDDADHAKQELERLQQESARIIAEARAEAQSIMVKSRADAENGPGRSQTESQGRRRCAPPQRPTSDRARDRPRAPADPRRGGRSVADRCVEVDQEEPDAGRQRRIDPEHARPDRHIGELTGSRQDVRGPNKNEAGVSAGWDRAGHPEQISRRRLPASSDV